MLDPADTDLHFDTFDCDASLLDGISDHWPVKRLQQFTHGFYKVHRAGDDVLITDLRMGAEGAYIFNFIVGQIVEGQVLPVLSEEADVERDFSSLGPLFRRVFDHTVVVPVPN